MKKQDLIEVNYDGWYVESADDNIITLRSDYTEDPIAEIYIKLEDEDLITVSYSSQNGDGVFFQSNISTAEEVAKLTIEYANDHFDYD